MAGLRAELGDSGFLKRGMMGGAGGRQAISTQHLWPTPQDLRFTAAQKKLGTSKLAGGGRAI